MVNYIGDFRNRAEQFADNTIDEDGLLQRAQYDTSSASLVNDVFGPIIYSQYNTEANFRAVLPVVDRSDEIMGANPFDRGNESVQAKAYRARHSPVSLQTHSEAGSVPSGNTASHEEVSFEVKRSLTVLEGSDLLEIESRIEDAVATGDIEPLQEVDLNLKIDEEGLAATPSSGNSGYSSRDKITELFRAVSSQDEQASADDESGTSYNAGDLDYGTITRASDSWADSTVDHNSGSNRQLNRSTMDGFLDTLGDNGSADPYEEGVILTGRDSARILSDLMADRGGTTQVVQNGNVDVDSVVDAETIRGMAASTRYRHYDGIPIVANQNAPATGAVSDVFVLNIGDLPDGSPRIAVEEYMDMYQERAGRNQQQGFLSIGNFKEEMLIKFDHELVVRDLSSQGKLRDLNA